jgi:hypothetical protein
MRGQGKRIPSPPPPPAVTSSSDKPIDNSNIGNQMLQNMGWRAGSGLGKKGVGITAPIEAAASTQREGVGNISMFGTPAAGAAYKTNLRLMAQKRYKQLDKS